MIQQLKVVVEQELLKELIFLIIIHQLHLGMGIHLRQLME
jgi:hypothetical protein